MKTMGCILDWWKKLGKPENWVFSDSSVQEALDKVAQQLTIWVQKDSYFLHTVNGHKSPCRLSHWRNNAMTDEAGGWTAIWLYFLELRFAYIFSIRFGAARHSKGWEKEHVGTISILVHNIIWGKLFCENRLKGEVHLYKKINTHFCRNIVFIEAGKVLHPRSAKYGCNNRILQTLSVAELEEGSMDYECSNQRTQSPLRYIQVWLPQWKMGLVVHSFTDARTVTQKNLKRSST